jgi:hypothetical protein
MHFGATRTVANYVDGGGGFFLNGQAEYVLCIAAKAAPIRAQLLQGVFRTTSLMI